MVGASLAFSLMNYFVKGSRHIPLMERVLFRNLVIILIPLTSALKEKKFFLWGRKENRKLLLLRSLFGLVGVIGYFYAISRLKFLADAAMLNRLSPFFVTLFSFLFLKEALHKSQIGVMILAFLGALLIIKPQWNLSMLPALGGILSGIAAGAAYTIIRGLHTKGERSESILFYFSAVSVAGSLPLLWNNFVLPSPTDLIYLLCIGVFAGLGQILLTVSYKYAPAGKVSIFSYSNILFSALLGWFVWDEIPDRWSVLGGLMILLPSIWLYFYSNQKEKVS